MKEKNMNFDSQNMPLFRFSLLMVVIIGIIFLLNGLIKSNFGYPPLQHFPGNGYQSLPSNKDLSVTLDQNRFPTSLPIDIQNPHRFIRQLEEKIFAKTNACRLRRSLDELSVENGLALTARFHSGAMAKKGFFNHQDLNGIGPSYRVAKLHRRFIGVIGENIFKMTKNSDNSEQAAEIIVQGWMNSPGHRENILRKSFDTLGVGCYEHLEKNQPWIYATQVFGRLIAYLSKDFPETVKPSQEISLRVKTICIHHKLPLAVLWVDAAHRGQSRKFTLNPLKGSKEMAGGKFITPSKTGLYQLVFHILVAGKNNSYSICYGPLFIVE